MAFYAKWPYRPRRHIVSMTFVKTWDLLCGSCCTRCCTTPCKSGKTVCAYERFYLFRSCLHTASGYDTVFGPRTLSWLSPCDGTQGLQPHLSIPPQDARPETDPRSRRLGPFDVPEHPDAVQPGSYFSRLARERRRLAIYTGPPLRYG